MRSETFWGQEIRQLSAEPEVWETTIERGRIRLDEPARVGINKRVADFLTKKKALLLVHCLDPKKDFYLPMGGSLKRVTTEEIESKFEDGEPMVMYLFQIPK